MDKTKRYELGDRIFCKNWEQLLTTGLILSSKGYGVNVIGRKDMMNDILTITALPEEKNEQIPDTNSVLEDIKAEIKEWYWQADKQAIAKDPCVVDAMIDLFIRTIDAHISSDPQEREGHMNCEDCDYTDIADWKQDKKTGKAKPVYWCERYRKLCSSISECQYKAESEV